MQFDSPLIPGTLIKRYKRFLADVELADGSVVVAHCANTGAMTGCAGKGFQVWLTQNNDPKRKLKYSWQLAVNHQQQWIGINTHNANAIVIEAIQQDRIPELMHYQTLQSEVKYGEEGSRIDILLKNREKSKGVQADCYVEVKSVTLLDNHPEEGQGWFPDAKTIRGQKHLRELAVMAKKGHRAILLFCVQHSGIQQVSIARHIDPDYAEAFQQAVQAGVEVLCYTCLIDQEKVILNQALSVNF